MTDFMKVLKDTPLASGAHHVDDGKGCVMEKVSILWALHTGQDVAATFSDLPECTNYVISKAAQYVNDTVSDEARQHLNKLIPRLLLARRTYSDARINVRLAVFSARSVLDLVGPNSREVCERAIAAAEARLENQNEETATAAAYAATAAYATANAAYAAYAATAAAYAAYAAANAAYATTNAATAAAYAAYAATATHADPVAFLDSLLDAWEKACTKENEDLYIPREWEDEALAFVAEWMEKENS